MTINCGGKIDIRYVNGAGTLTIQPSCSVKTEFIEIQGSEEEISEIDKAVELTSEMKFNWRDIVDDIIKLGLENIKNDIAPRVLDDEELDILEKISTGVSVIKALTSKTRNEPHLFGENMEILMYVTIAVILIAITFKSIQLLKTCLRIRPLATNTHHSNTDSFIEMDRIV